jgi:hypothetical protein
MRKALLLAVLACLVGCHAVRGQDTLVELTVREPAGVARVHEPVTTGLPFAQAALPAAPPLALVDARGGYVPLQTRVLARWPDGSVKWVLLDFQVEKLAARGNATFKLVAGAARGVRKRGVTVATTDDAVVVDTGPMEAAIDRKQFSLFRSVSIDGAEILREAAGGLAITDTAGKTRMSAADQVRDYRVMVVEAGPLRTVVHATGEVQATDTHLLGFTCWYHFYAGKKFARVFLTMRNLSGKAFTQTDQHHVHDLAYEKMVLNKHEGNLAVEAIDLVLPRKRPAAKPAFVFGGDKGVVTGQLDDGTVTLYQDSSASWPWQVGTKSMTDPWLVENQKFMAAQGKPDLPYFEWTPAHYRALLDKKNYIGCSFRGYKAETNDATRPQVQGDRAPGWAHLGSTTVGVRYFWQTYPKSLVLSSDGTIRLGLWPKEWSNPHVFEGHIHKTHELLFAFGDETPAETFARFDRRLLALAPNTWYCSSGAFNGYLMPENREKYARFEDWALTAVKCGVNPNINPSWDSSLEIEREKYDQYGVWHFGDTSKRGWRGFGQYLELDIPYGLAVHFVRTLNRSFFDELEIHERQRQDVPAHGGGYGHQKGESSHYYTTGALFYYYLTGLEHIKQSIKASHDAFARVGPWHARSFGMTMWSNLDMYRAYDDADPTCGQPWHYPHPPWKKADYMNKIQGDLKWFLGSSRRPRQDPATGFRGYGRFNFQEFMLGIMMDALGRYATEFPDERIWRDRLVALANATMKPLPDFKYKPDWLRMANPNGYTYAYIFTGRDKYLDFAAKIMDKGLRPDDKTWPRFRTGTGAGKSWSEFGHRLTQTHMWARWYRSKNGTPEPPEPIQDLNAEVKDGKVVLSWTAPKGRPEEFFVKLAPQPLKDDLASKTEGKTVSNWWTTPVAATLTVKPDAGTAKFSVTVEASKGTSYAAVRSARQAGPITAISDLSNAVKVEVK